MTFRCLLYTNLDNISLRKINDITESFPVSGQFDAVAVIDVTELSEIKNITTEIQKIPGVERTETMVEVNP